MFPAVQGSLPLVQATPQQSKLVRSSELNENRPSIVQGSFPLIQSAPHHSASKSIRSPKHPCPYHNNVQVRVSAINYQSIHAETIMPFVFQEHTVTSASTSRHAQTIVACVLQEHTVTSASMPRHAQTIVTFVLQEHTVTSASMPKPYFVMTTLMFKCMRLLLIIVLSQ